MYQSIEHASQDNLIPLPGWRAAPRLAVGLADCSLIIPTYRRPLEAREQIENLCRLGDVPAEVLFIDSSPDNETELALKEATTLLELPFELIYVKSPKGLTLQRNIGLDICTRPLIFFLDDDAFPKPDYFQSLRASLIGHNSNDVGAAGACIINEIDKPIPGRWRVRRALRLVPRCEPYVYNDVGSSAPSGLLKAFTGVRDVDIFQGGACAIKRAVLDAERFSEFFKGYAYGEDVEMSMRVRRRWRVVFCGDAHIFHRGTSSTVGGRPDGFQKGKMEVINRYFIWNRYSSHTSFLNRVRLYADFLFVVAMDLGWTVAKPGQWRYASHAFGILAGIWESIVSPPVYDEPPVRRRYALNAALGATQLTAPSVI